MFDKLEFRSAAVLRPVGKDFALHLEEIYAADFGSRFDVIVRYAAITSTGILLAWFYSVWMFLPWLLAYLGTNVVYLVALSKARAPVQFQTFAAIVALNVVTSGIFAAMPIYLWFTQTLPDSMRCASCTALNSSLVQIVAPRP